MTSTDTPVDHSRVVQKDRVVIRFAGDSGDGMQLTGDRFTSETAAFGMPMPSAACRRRIGFA